MDWIHLAKDKEKWWAYVNAVMDPWVASSAGYLLTA